MFNFIMAHKLQEFVTPLTVYLRSEKGRKHFEETNILWRSGHTILDMQLV